MRLLQRFPSGPAGAVVGSWSLQTANGQALPHTAIQTPSLKSEILGHFLTFTAAGAFTDNMSWRDTQSGNVTTGTQVSSGTYIVSGTDVSLHYAQPAHTFSGSVDGTMFTVTSRGIARVFGKQ